MSDYGLPICIVVTSWILGASFMGTLYKKHIDNYILNNCEAQQYIEVRNRRINCTITGEWIDE
jgi:hypothetical protein